MKKTRVLTILAVVFTLLLIMAVPVLAAGDVAAAEAAVSSNGGKAIAAGIAIGLAAGLGALGMGLATGKSAEATARQPEIKGDIRTSLILGIVFMETAIIYALIVAILIIFVM